MTTLVNELVKEYDNIFFHSFILYLQSQMKWHILQMISTLSIHLFLLKVISIDKRSKYEESC